MSVAERVVTTVLETALPGGADPAMWRALEPQHRAATRHRADVELARRGMLSIPIYPLAIGVLFWVTDYFQRYFTAAIIFSALVVGLVLVRVHLMVRVVTLGSKKPGLWRRWHSSTIVLLGLVWGTITALVLGVDGLTPSALFVLLVTNALAGGSVGMLAQARSTSWGFSLSSLLPAAVVALSLEAALSSAFGVGLLLLATFNFVTAARLARERWSELTARAMIEQREQEFRELIDQNPVGLVVLRDGRVAYCNPVWASILDYEDPRELQDMTVRQLLSGRACNEAIDGNAAQSDSLPIGDTRLTTRTGKNIVVALSAGRQIRYEDAPAVLVAGSDVTEKEQMLAQLRLADRLASVGSLAAGIGHEINNPLSWMIGNLEYVCGELARRTLVEPDWDELQQALQETTDGAHRVSTIVKDLRTFARREAEGAANEVLEVEQVIATAINITSAKLGRKASLTRELTKGLHVEANESRLVQVLVNLLLNAAQSIPDGEVDRHSISLLTEQEAERVVITVCDTGKGIPPEVLPHIFDPFFTTKPPGEGTGLGLSISHNIISSLGGELQLESQPGRGTTARIVLPLAAPHQPPTPTVERQSTSNAVRAQVLVIDDEVCIGRSLMRGLGEHEVTVEDDPQQAFTLLVEQPERFDIVFCDLMMPTMSGMELYGALKKRLPSLAEKLVFITGDTLGEASQQFLGGVENPVFSKPFDFEEVRSFVAMRMHDSNDERDSSPFDIA
jgi:two-component system cell cycle sensor histidine kinase/response regulator CckA